jgi:amino acid transporter
MFLAGTFSITSNSRMMYAFSRDGALPGSTFFHKVDVKRKTPVRTGEAWPRWLICSVLISRFSLASRYALFHTGLAVIGKQRRLFSGHEYRYHWTIHLLRFKSTLRSAVTCTNALLYSGIPIALRVIYRRDFKKGPFHLGAFSLPISMAAILWIIFISIIFILPQVNPVNSHTLNYSVVAVGIVMVYSLGLWFLSARRWFTGSIKQLKGVSSVISAYHEMIFKKN